MKNLINETKLTMGISELIKNQHLCLEACLAVLMRYYKQRFAHPLVECFSFKFRENGIKIVDRLDPGIGLFGAYEKYGYTLEKRWIQSYSKYFDYLKESVRNGNPVIVHYNCYYLPWDPGYHRISNEHVVIVDGYEDKRFHVLDPYFGQSREVEMEMLECASQFYLYLELKEVKTWNYKNTLQRKIVDWNSEGYFEMLNNFAAEVGRMCIEDECFAMYSFDAFYHSEFMTKLLRIRTNKYRFYLFLKEWEEYAGRGAYGESFSKVITQWAILKAAFIKAFYRHFTKDMLKNAAECLYRIGEVEHEFIEKVFHTECDQVFSCVRKKTKGDKYLFDIMPYCNNKGFTKIIGDKRADCTGLGEYILLCNDTEQWEKRGYRMLEGNEVDNIRCLGQRICLPKDVKALGIFITAEWGEFDVSFLVIGENGEKFYFPVMIGDWADPDKGEIDLGKMYKRHEKSDELFKMHCYASEVIMPSPNGCRELKLPECPNVHILSIIMWR